MRELEFLKIINNILTKKSHIGDDSAYLKDLGIVITQDSFIEDVHFSQKYSSAYEIGYKSLIVNISDILASGAKPVYATVGLSLPKNIDDIFVKELYRAFNEVCQNFDMEIVGGDITGADKIFISICVIGDARNKNISSRANAKVGDAIIITGTSGSSAAGLFVLQNNLSVQFPKLVKEHKMPELSPLFSEEISKYPHKYAMMDTSDGLADALLKIAAASNKELFADLTEVPIDNDIKLLAERYNKNYKDWVLFGGEDYRLIACCDKKNLIHIPQSSYKIIGQVREYTGNYVQIKDDDIQFYLNDANKTYDHFS